MPELTLDTLPLESRMLDDLIVRWTARLFVGCYLVRVGIDAGGYRDARSQLWARMVWTVGCVICWIHVAVSFHLLMGWSHAAAYEHVLKRTQETTGLESGAGLYVNYGFALVWLADVIIWWQRLDWVERRVPYWTVQGIFAFLIIQATVVFGPWFWTPVAVVMLIILGLLFRQRRNGR